MRKWIALALVLLVVLVTRVYGMSAESVWYDEAVSVGLMDEPTLTAFLDSTRTVDKLKVPLYFTIEYAWWRLVSDSVIGLRWLSVVIALGTATVLFQFTERLCGLLPAVVSTLFFALSKPFIFYGQEIRMYGLMYLLALASWFALHRATHGARKAWYLNAAFNLLLINTHLFGAFNFAAQGIYLFALNPREWRRYAGWAVANGIIVLSVVPWVLRFATYEKAVAWIVVPPPSFLVESFAFVFPGTKFDCVESLDTTHFVTACTVALLALGLTITGVRRAWVSGVDRATALMLLSWLFVPYGIMFVASYAARPCYVDRYALYAVFPLYLLIGYGASALRPAIRWPVLASLLALGLFTVTTIERPMRADVAGAADFIRFNAEADDRIAIRGMGLEYSLPIYYPEATRRLGSPRQPLRQSVREVARGTRTWFVFDPLFEEFPQWMKPIDEAIGKGRVKLELEKTTRGPKPVYLMLLAPAGDARVQ